MESTPSGTSAASTRSATAVRRVCSSSRRRVCAAGKTLDETADWLEENRLRVHQMGVLEDLFFCKRMGRVSGAAAVMGTLVGIRPLADINEGKGLSDVIGKTRGLAPALKATVDYMARTVERPEEQIMLLSHSGPPGARGGAAHHGRRALPPEGAARCTGVPVVRRVDRAGPVRHLLFWPPDLVRPDGGAQPDRGADGKNEIIAREPAAVEPLAPFFLQFTKSGSYVFGTCQIRASYNRKSWKNLLIFQKTRGKNIYNYRLRVCRGVWEGVPMKHLLRAMGAAMLAALLSACSTPQEQTEPSRAADHAGHAGRNRRDGGRRRAEELLALPRDLAAA